MKFQAILDPLQSRKLTFSCKMKVIFEISTIKLVKNTYSLADLFSVLHIVEFLNFLKFLGIKYAQNRTFWIKLNKSQFFLGYDRPAPVTPYFRGRGI